MGNCTTCRFAVYKGHDKRGMYPDYYCWLARFVQANPYAECESYKPRVDKLPEMKGKIIEGE